jgi:hypothetical protein
MGSVKKWKQKNGSENMEDGSENMDVKIWKQKNGAKKWSERNGGKRNGCERNGGARNGAKLWSEIME